ncbi:MAG: non-hydrolyzing UDP-N-acetylglucosamine 2-epimerase [Planctomycetota bacterium]
MKTVLLVFGTRPEAIKMAPVVAALRARAEELRTIVAVTGQHRAMLDQVLAAFGLAPDIDLDLMRPGQTPNDVAARLLERTPPVLRETGADVVVVQGDTTSAMAAGLAAFHERVPVAHVEAGLRSGRMDSPFPEEMNRVVLDRLSTWLFPPTQAADDALAAEGVAPEQRLVTGNTSIDALLTLRERVGTMDLAARERFGGCERLVLVTLHRRESFGAPLAGLLAALQELAGRHPDVDFVYPVHPNPAVHGPAHATLKADNIHLTEPLPYPDLVWLLDRAELTLTDSGGIQEEAPALGTPVLILRDVTERPEVVSGGAGLLLGTDRDTVVRAADRWLADPSTAASFRRPRLLFGDGDAGTRIAAVLAGEHPAPFVAPSDAQGARA